jgi:DNA-binding response OmpR family regulator
MPKILIIDDDQDFVSAVSIVLESSGFQAVKAYSRSTGMEVFQQEKPDLIILDVMMQEPDDGFVMAQDIKKVAPHIPILMLTSVGQVTGMEFDRDADMVPVEAFEQKPIMPARLVERIRELLKQ